MNDIVDFHIHTSPSLLPRHHDDLEIETVLRDAGVGTFVLKAHEGSTAERAQLAGHRAVGGIVLNSPVGGANPDAVQVAAALGARIAWLPTLSARAHQQAHDSAELSVHHGISFAPVTVTQDGHMLARWNDVLDVVAVHDMVLASGHVSMDETVAVFRRARSRGVRRLLVNHPLMPYLGWRSDHIEQLIDLEAHLEVGVLADLLGRTDEPSATARLAAAFPSSLMVFGSDLGHSSFPDHRAGIETWITSTERAIGSDALTRIMTSNGAGLLAR